MEIWEKTLINSNATLRQAIETINKAALQIALIVNNDRKLLGTLTDGDVRRALLKNITLDTPVVQVMNAKPKTGEKSWTKSKILDMLQQNKLLQLPLLNSHGQVIGLTSMIDNLNKNYSNNPVFLMAGGLGTRLRPLTDNCPKPMLKVGDKPILEKILMNFADAGFHRFYISTHYMAEIIRDYFGNGEKWGVNIKYIYEDKLLGTAGALGLLPHDEIDQPMFVMNGDILTNIDPKSILTFHEHENCFATMCVRQYKYKVPFGVVTSKGSHVKKIVEKPTHHFFVNAGIYLLEPNLVKSVPSEQYIDMPTLLEREIENGKVVSNFPIHEFWLDIGQIEDFNQAQNINLY